MSKKESRTCHEAKRSANKEEREGRETRKTALVSVPVLLFFSLLPPCWSMVIFLDQWFRNDAVNNERACLHTVFLPSAHPWYDIIPWLHQTSWKGGCIPFDTNFNLLLAIDNLFIAQKGWYAVFFLRLCQGGGGREQNRKNELNWSSFRILAARPVRPFCSVSPVKMDNPKFQEHRVSMVDDHHSLLLFFWFFFAVSRICLRFKSIIMFTIILRINTCCRDNNHSASISQIHQRSSTLNCYQSQSCVQQERKGIDHRYEKSILVKIVYVCKIFPVVSAKRIDRFCQPCRKHYTETTVSFFPWKTSFTTTSNLHIRTT